MIQRHLLDLNVLIAITEASHPHFRRAHAWFGSAGKHPLGICPLTEAGFIRVTTNPTFLPAPRSVGQAIAILQTMKGHPGYSFWEMSESWVSKTAPFARRISGHRQVTDAYLLGLAIKQNGVLVTFDKGISTMAGAEFRSNVLVLE